MEFTEIWNIALIVIAIISATSWGVIFKRGRRVWKNLQEVSDQYSAAIEDGNISDEERIEIADTVVEIIIDTASIWQTLSNLVRRIIPVIKR